STDSQFGVNDSSEWVDAPGDATVTATWQITGLDPAKHYEVYIDYESVSGSATDVTYRLLSGSSQLGSDISVDQSQAPSVYFGSSRAWRILGAVAPLNGNLTVVLDASAAAGHVVADAVMLREVIPGAEETHFAYDGFGKLLTRTNGKD